MRRLDSMCQLLNRFYIIVIILFLYIRSGLLSSQVIKQNHTFFKNRDRY